MSFVTNGLPPEPAVVAESTLADLEHWVVNVGVYLLANKISDDDQTILWGVMDFVEGYREGRFRLPEEVAR
jgi:hypothetical protein